MLAMKKYVQLLLLILFLAACGTEPSPTPDVHATAAWNNIQLTITALDATVQAQSAAQTEAAKATDTPLPTATISPTLPDTVGISALFTN